METREELEEELNELYLAEERLLKQQLYKKDLFELCKLMGFNDLGKAHKKLCDEMVRTRPLFRRRLFLFFRGFFKTSVITQANAVQEILNNPDVRILIVSSTLENAKMSLRVIKNTFWINPEFRSVFPDYCPPEESKEFGTQTAFSVPNKTRVAREGTVECAGVGQTLVGRHYDKIILSDLVTDKNVNTRATMKKTEDWVSYALSLLNNPGQDQLDIEGTAYDFGDFHMNTLEKARKDTGTYFVMRGPIHTNGIPLFPERFSMDDVRKIEQDQGSSIFCNPHEAPILMSDWTTKPIGDIQVGDEIIGFIPKSGLTNKGIYKKAKVTKLHSRIALTQKMTMASGQVIRCTPNHMWYSGRQDKTHREYYEAKEGRILQRCVHIKDKDTDIEKIKAWNYLAGMIDGDGGCKHYGIFITQCKHANPKVYDKIKQTLDFLGIEYTEQEHEREEKKQRIELMGFKRDSYKQNVFYLKGGRQTKFDLLNNADLAKKYQILDGLWERNASVFVEEKVEKIVPDKYETVYGLTTETGNYIVWGFASKNSGQYLLEPINEGTAIFKKKHIYYVDRNKLPRDNKRQLAYPTWMTIDTAVSENSDADESVITVAMFDPDNVEYVVDMRHGHWSIKEIGTNLMQMYKLYSPESIGMETIAFQKLFNYIFDEMFRNENIILPFVELKRDNRRSKAMRIKAMQPRFEQHKIMFCDDLDKVYIESQLLRFDPDKNTNKDDFLDTIADMEIIKMVPKKEEIDQYSIFPNRRWIDFLNTPKEDRAEESFVHVEEGEDGEYSNNFN